MKRLLVSLVLGCCGLSASAQFNDSTHYYLKYASTGAINRTNNGNAYLLNNAFNFKVSKKMIDLNAMGSYVYGKQNHDLTNNDVSAALVFNLYRGDKRFYYWGLANYDKSYSLKINNRFQGGGGVAYDVVRNKTFTLNLSDGLLFETSDLYLQDTIPDVYHTFRNSFRLQYKLVIQDIIVLDGSNFFQNSLSNGNDYIIKSNTNLSVKLRSWLSITAAVQYNKLNRTDRENFLFNYGVTIEKYF
ncbi:DUF481 domain-containing protein [Chitinophaga vietnamensis]|uniref:DUF481 domain-containing protein n=1 Tax=Chitinophaga vietnamensis TaxID=2593957 RepID=UPI0011779095|nr:DUF481 domain-containing protein [Chitinophaga vietnamensis]